MTSKEKIPLIVICGATASGKTALGIELAKLFNGEIVSADSMQIYKGMTIATAKPTAKEMQGIPHHMMDFLSPESSYSVAEYVKEAKSVIADIYSRKKTPLLVGGTGLYIQSLLENICFGEIDVDENLRQELYDRLQREGAENLLHELAVFDEQSAQRIGTANHRRLIRAIEIYYTTGKTMTEFIENSKNEPSPYRDVRIGLTCQDRQKLYDRINRRVDEMIQSGLIDEAKEYLSKHYSNTSAKAIGYKELSPYFEGTLSFTDAVENLKQATRRYAKRQLTWFRRDKEIHWLYTDTTEKDELIKKAVAIIKKSGILIDSIKGV